MLVWVKRGVLALESIAKSQATLAEISTPEKKRIPKMAEVFTPDVREMNDEWQRQRDREVYGGE